jgi:hypothetical protein
VVCCINFLAYDRLESADSFRFHWKTLLYGAPRGGNVRE